MASIFTMYERACDLIEADLGDELVGLNVHAGQCFGFNEVATSVWRLLAQPRTAAELQSALMNQYEVQADQCAADIGELLEQMQERGLVRPVDLR